MYPNWKAVVGMRNTAAPCSGEMHLLAPVAQRQVLACAGVARQQPCALAPGVGSDGGKRGIGHDSLGGGATGQAILGKRRFIRRLPSGAGCPGVNRARRA